MATTLCEDPSTKTSDAPGPATPERDRAMDWAATTLAARLKILGRARLALAGSARELAALLPGFPERTPADSLAAELLPLLEACKFLERNAASILKERRLGRRGLPFWLSGLDSRVQRVAFGSVLVIGPSNYPLLLPGVQALQALAAGNTVVWKPGRGGERVARLFASLMIRSGLPQGVLRVTDESVEAATQELAARPGKVVFTGSARAGAAVSRLAADNAIPVIAELSGCDAIVVLPSADPARVVSALAFGMRLNGSATCMAPRRLFLMGEGSEDLLEQLKAAFAHVRPIQLGHSTGQQLSADLEQARQMGATVTGQMGGAMLVTNGRPEMRIAQADVFAPVLTVMRVRDRQALLEAYSACPYALTVAVFGAEREALEIGQMLCAGTVMINDLIVPTADPRVPFGGRRASGYGVTRGAEGLLEMTAVRTVLVRRGKSLRHYEETGEAHARLFHGVIAWQHGAGWRARVAGLKAVFSAVKEMR